MSRAPVAWKAAARSRWGKCITRIDRAAPPSRSRLERIDRHHGYAVATLGAWPLSQAAGLAEAAGLSEVAGLGQAAGRARS